MDLPYPADLMDDVQAYSYAKPPYQDVPNMLINFIIDAEELRICSHEQLW